MINAWFALRCTPQSLSRIADLGNNPRSHARFKTNSPRPQHILRCSILPSAAMPEMQQRGSLISSINANSQSSKPQADPHGASALPPWVHINDGNEDHDTLLSPDRAKPNTRHYKPPPSHYKPGRKWDHLRSAEPPLLSLPIADSQARWKPFMQSGPNPQFKEGRIVDAAWMEQNMPDLNPDWHPEDEEEAGPTIFSARGLMYKGKWLISPERQERTVRLFWVSTCLYSHLLDYWICWAMERTPSVCESLCGARTYMCYFESLLVPVKVYWCSWSSTSSRKL